MLQHHEHGLICPSEVTRGVVVIGNLPQVKVPDLLHSEFVILEGCEKAKGAGLTLRNLASWFDFDLFFLSSILFDDLVAHAYKLVG